MSKGIGVINNRCFQETYKSIFPVIDPVNIVQDAVDLILHINYTKTLDVVSV